MVIIHNSTYIYIYTYIHTYFQVRGFFRLRNVIIVGFYYLFNNHMFRSYDLLQAEIYLLELTLLKTDQSMNQSMMLTNILKTKDPLSVYIYIYI
jgi:hypothetical protein